MDTLNVSIYRGNTNTHTHIHNMFTVIVLLQVKAKELEEMGWFEMLMIYDFREGQKG